MPTRDLLSSNPLATANHIQTPETRSPVCPLTLTGRSSPDSKDLAAQTWSGGEGVSRVTPIESTMPGTS